MKFLMLYFFEEQPWKEMPETKREDALGCIAAYVEQPHVARAIIHSGELRGTYDATTVDLGTAGHTDRFDVQQGPFIGAPQSLGGYWVIDVSAPEDAAELARGWPTGGVFEIRPLVER